MPRMRLSKSAADAIGPSDKPAYYYDTDLIGFFLRVMPSGAKTWGFEYRAGSGRKAEKKRITIATAGKITPEEARKVAKRYSAEVTLGRDPAAERRAASEAMTVAELIRFYEQEGCYIQRGRRMGEAMKERTKRYTLARLNHHVVPLLGKRKAADVNAADIERMVRDIEAGKTAKDEKLGPHSRVIVRGGAGAARKVVRDLSAVLSFATRRGIVPSNACDKAAVRRTDNQRDRYLRMDELIRLGAAFLQLEEEGVNPKALQIARLWALTGCRRNEIAALRWTEIDFDEGLIRFEASKTGKNIRPLAAAARAILELVPRTESPFVFPAESGTGHFQGTKGIWKQAVEKAGLHGVTPHTLRHTVGSTAASKGEALSMIGAILGHRNVRSTAIYAHVQHDPSRIAADRVTSAINDALAGGRNAGAVEVAKARSA